MHVDPSSPLKYREAIDLDRVVDLPHLPHLSYREAIDLDRVVNLDPERVAVPMDVVGEDRAVDGDDVGDGGHSEQQGKPPQPVGSEYIGT